MLFDFKAERDPFFLAQGALLLSYYSSSAARHLNTFWLGVAIQSSMSDGVHNYDKDESLTQYERLMKKRLWWCCVIRDRVLSLGLRRPLQISHSHFDFNSKGLDKDDFQDDIGKSEVYDTNTQCLLAKIIEAQCRLAIEMTDIIIYLYPSISPSVFSTGTNRCKSKLSNWHQTVMTWTSEIPRDSHDSVTLYTSYLYIYY
jgi:Fe-S oxidoreductase